MHPTRHRVPALAYPDGPLSDPRTGVQHKRREAAALVHSLHRVYNAHVHQARHGCQARMDGRFLKQQHTAHTGLKTSEGVGGGWERDQGHGALSRRLQRQTAKTQVWTTGRKGKVKTYTGVVELEQGQHQVAHVVHTNEHAHSNDVLPELLGQLPVPGGPATYPPQANHTAPTTCE